MPTFTFYTTQMLGDLASFLFLFLFQLQTFVKQLCLHPLELFCTTYCCQKDVTGVLRPLILFGLCLIRAPPGLLLPSFCPGIFKQYIGARNRVGIGLSYQPAMLHRMAELISWNRVLGSLKV
jgi:hypothetical protein